MSRWDAYWFGPVAAVRPYLLFRALLLLLAADLWFLQPSGAAYIGSYGFDVSHFAWLDVVQPTPAPPLKYAVILWTGFAVAMAALTSSRVASVCGLLLFTWSWAMSMHDVLQHHYLLSLALFCLALFPRIRAREIWGDGAPGVVARAGPRTSAFGFALLSVTLAIVYLFAAITKTDAEWLSGAALAAVSDSHHLVAPLVRGLGALGISEGAVWRAVGTGSVLAELAVAVAYLSAPGRDRNASPALRWWWFAAAAAPLSVHLIFTQLGLRIGWFTAYMLTAACIYFLPERWLLVAGSVATWPVRWLQRIAEPGIERAGIPAAVVSAAVAVSIAIVGLALLTGLPGALAAGLGPALVLCLATAQRVARGSARDAVGMIAAAALAAVVMTATILGSNIRFHWYNNLADPAIDTGTAEEARTIYEQIRRFAPDDMFAPHLRLADLAMQLGLEADAVRHLGRASELAPRDFFAAQAALAEVALGLGLEREAVVHLRRAVALDPGNAPLLNNLAWLLVSAPDADPRHLDEALELSRRAVELTNREVAVMLDTLASVHSARGDLPNAVATAREAIAAATASGDVDVAREARERLVRYEAALRALGPPPTQPRARVRAPGAAP